MKISNQRVATLSAEGLPPGWALATIGEMIDFDGVFTDGDWVESKDQDPDGDVRLIQLADVGDGTYRDRSNRYLTHAKAIELGCTFLELEDVLIARMPDPLGRACMFPGDLKRSVTAVDVCIVRTGGRGANHRWLMYSMNSPAVRAVVASLQSGSTRKRISRRNLARIELPVPPLAEQQRIVGKIEEVLSQLAPGMAALEKAKVQLRRYRQAVLMSAMEGELTKEWREAHKGELEPAWVLLERISEKRKQAKGKSREYPKLDSSDIPALPAGWMYLFLEDMTTEDGNAIRRGPFGSAVKKEYFVPAGYRVYEQKNVIANDFTLGNYYIDEDKFSELKRFELRGEDIVITCSGTIGKIAITPHNIQPGIINQALLKITLDDTVVLPKYFVFLFKSKLQDILLHSTRGSAMKNISSVRALKKIPFPIASPREQRRIVEEMERRFSIADGMERVLDESLVRAERLRQSILRKAFEGNLVPQDPSDEPASVLLEGIKAEKAGYEAEKKARRRGRKKKHAQQLKLL